MYFYLHCISDLVRRLGSIVAVGSVQRSRQLMQSIDLILRNAF